MTSPPFHLPRRFRALSALALVVAGAVAAEAAAHDHPAIPAAASAMAVGERSFLAENEVAMAGMMTAMNVEPTGDVDRDFVAMMIPHHQGAIDMADALLRHGRNETVRRLAQEIIVTQRDEIAALRLAVGDRPPAPTR